MYWACVFALACVNTCLVRLSSVCNSMLGTSSRVAGHGGSYCCCWPAELHLSTARHAACHKLLHTLAKVHR